MDAEKQRLAASLFGGGSGASPARTRRMAAPPRGAATPPKPASQENLLGDISSTAAPPQQQQQHPPQAAGLDMLLDVGTAPSAAARASSATPLDPLAALSGLDVPSVAPGAGSMDLLGSLGDLMGPGLAAPQQHMPGPSRPFIFTLCPRYSRMLHCATMIHLLAEPLACPCLCLLEHLCTQKLVLSRVVLKASFKTLGLPQG
jgi:hypothetical protein